MKNYYLTFYLILLPFFSCDASEDAMSKVVEDLFLSTCKSKISLMDVYTEKLNLIFLIKPSCLADEETIIPLKKLQAVTRRTCFGLTIENKIWCSVWIKDEEEFFNKSIKLREIFVREIYYAALDLAGTQILMLPKRFEMFIGVPGDPHMCEFKNGKPIYHEGFMKR